MRPRTWWTVFRVVHLGVAVAIGIEVYAPEDISAPLRPFLMFVGMPVAAVSGLVLWKRASVWRLMAAWGGSGHRPRRRGRGDAATTSRRGG